MKTGAGGIVEFCSEECFVISTGQRVANGQTFVYVDLKLNHFLNFIQKMSFGYESNCSWIITLITSVGFIVISFNSLDFYLTK